MPTVINLKDITTSDSQVSFAEKLNFNFNQLLTLGVGQPGPVGPQGPGGPPGPQGLSGAKGLRGTRWFTNADLNLTANVRPTDVDFTPPLDLQYGDIYSNSRFEVYEYRNVAGTGKWVNTVNPNTIFTAANSATLIRDFSPAGSGNPNGTRFVTFINYLGADRSTSSSNPFYNDMLFLHNFDQTQVASEFTGSNMLGFYTAMQNIYVDHTVSSDDLQVRNHIELGSLYSNNGIKITKNNENLKVKYKIDGDTRLAHFNISKNDGDDAATLGNFNSAVKFSISKYVNSVHKTLDFAFTSSEKTKQFTDLSFEQIDGLTLRADTTKVAFGIKNLGTVNALALIGSAGTGAPTGIYSNLPFYQIGTDTGEAQFSADTIKLVSDSDNKYLRAVSGELTIDSNGKGKIKINDNLVEILADAGDAVETSIKVTPAGKIGVGQTVITQDGTKRPATNTLNPSANLMVNGSLGTGIRSIITGSLASEMNLRQEDMTLCIRDIPGGSNGFNLGDPALSTLRLVVVCNFSTATVDIHAGSSTIGSLLAKQTAIYQSFGTEWVLVMTGPNTLATSGGSGGGGATQKYWAELVITNIQVTGTVSNGTKTADIQVLFYSDQNGTLAVPVSNLQVRIDEQQETFVNSESTGSGINSHFVTCTGGNPHVILPNYQIYWAYRDNYTKETEKEVSTFFLRSAKSGAPLDKQQDTTTLLSYYKVGETP